MGRITGINKSSNISRNVTYDEFDRVNGLTLSLLGKNITSAVLYGDFGQVNSFTNTIGDKTDTISYTYDDFYRVKSRNLNGMEESTEYTYLKGQNGQDTTLVESFYNSKDTYSYTYDVYGNILTVSKGGVLLERYTYDSLHRLTKVTKGSDVYTYTYDAGGNITSVKKNGVSVKEYSYGDNSWSDRLTSFNGTNINYDEIGNPLNWRNNMTLSWEYGRRLKTVTADGNDISYTYDADGLRTSKTVNGVKTEYYWLDGVLQGQKTGSEYIIFLYDENGTAYGMLINQNGVENYYYYLFNLQGDIVGIMDSSGNTVAEYTYDAWGQLLTDQDTLANTIGGKNPLRYRGYYYDSETGFYYLKSRYYDPYVQRFINADGYVSTGQGILGNNMFAYCNNNPVSRKDTSGQGWITAIVITVVATVTAVVAKNHMIAQKNKKANSKVDSNSKTTTKNKLINDQNGDTGENFKYGRYSASWNACETIAVHNAKVLNGIESSLSETMYDFQMAGAMPLYGVLGSNPYAIGTVLNKSNIDYSRVGLDEITNPGTYIISYWTGPFPSSIHTVAISYDGSVYTTYNLYGDNKTYNDNPTDYAERYICGYYLR